MTRQQLFEFEDFEQTPAFIRDSITDLLYLIHRIAGTAGVFAPKVAEVMRTTGQFQILDLCSGAGGPTPLLVEELNSKHGLDVRATLTDLYPNLKAAGKYNKNGGKVNYLTKPVNAAAIPEEMSGVRLMNCSFHHMPEPVAQGILSDAFHKRSPICVFEITENSLPGVLTSSLFPFGIALAMPFTTGADLQKLFFTYALPLVPLAGSWDAFASQLRTYSQSELRAMTAHLQAPDYVWEIGTLPHPFWTHEFPYLTGKPV